jgi:hypothetical protein
MPRVQGRSQRGRQQQGRSRRRFTVRERTAGDAVRVRLVRQLLFGGSGQGQGRVKPRRQRQWRPLVPILVRSGCGRAFGLLFAAVAPFSIVVVVGGVVGWPEGVPLVFGPVVSQL